MRLSRLHQPLWYLFGLHHFVASRFAQKKTVAWMALRRVLGIGAALSGFTRVFYPGVTRISVAILKKSIRIVNKRSIFEGTALPYRRADLKIYGDSGYF